MPRTLALSFLSLILLLTFGPWAIARIPPMPSCNPAEGLHLYAQADARDNGYLLPPAGIRHFQHAVYDLLQGRIRFFEMEESPSGWSATRWRTGTAPPASSDGCSISIWRACQCWRAAASAPLRFRYQPAAT